MPLARSVLVARAVLESPRRDPSTDQYPGRSLREHARRPAPRLRGRTVGALRDPIPYEDIVQEHLFDDPLAIVAGAQHSLAGRGAPTLAALSRFPWIAPRAILPCAAF